MAFAPEELETLRLGTRRLTLVPVTLRRALAEQQSLAALGVILNAVLPARWPPPTMDGAADYFVEALTQSPGDAGWHGWYVLLATLDLPRLIGSVGFNGPPEHGTVSLGYALAPEFWGAGYATEAVRALVGWAFARGVTTILADVAPDNVASQRVLSKCGFLPVSYNEVAQLRRYALAAPSA